MKPLHFIIKRPLLSEKVTKQGKIKIIAFEVAEDASKIAIKQAVEKAFDVKVQDVNTMVVPGKMKRVKQQYGKRSNWKKAYVSLTPDSKMDFFGA